MVGLPWMPAEAAESAAFAVIDVAGGGDHIEIVGKAVAAADVTVSGTLSINRRGSGGTVSSSQSGRVTIKAGETASIARVGVSFRPGDNLAVRLVLTLDGETISQATLETGLQ